jgi:diguanylate cyclase (GGDEF)-like protein
MSNSSSCGSCGQPHGVWATDRLTLLLDRWGWDTQAPDILAASGSTALLVVDLDNFKRVNDRFGHVAGDAVLKAVADTLRESTRKGDLLGRYGGHGGDEFLVMLPETGMDDALMVAERIQRAIRAIVVDAPTQSGTVSISAITASFGVSVGSPDTDLETLVVEADAALRRAKRTGRDRIRTLGGKRPLRVPMAIVTACAAGAVVIVSVTGDARQVVQSAAPEPPRPVLAPPTVTLPPVTVPTTVTMTTTMPPRPVVPARQPKQTTPASTPSAEPAARSVETPPKATRKPCPVCEMVNGVMNDFMPFMPR